MPKPVAPSKQAPKPGEAGIEAGNPQGVAGLDVGLRLVAGVIGLGAVGFGVDYVLGTLPWLMLLGGVVGFVSWLVSVARRKPRSGM
jgi:F0F1-type ATP synthase assembly protein I